MSFIDLVDQFRQPLIDFWVLDLRSTLLGPFKEIAIEIEVDSLFDQPHILQQFSCCLITGYIFKSFADYPHHVLCSIPLEVQG